MHAYDRTGNPQHWVPTTTKNAKSDTRPTTVKDIVKHGWLPSVTGIIAQLRRWGLEQWIIGQHIQTCWEADEKGPLDEYEARIRRETDRRLAEAPEKGSDIHGAIEAWLAGKPHDKTYQRYVDAFAGWHKENVKEVILSEANVVGDGYAGRLDLLYRRPNGDVVLADIKTSGKPKPYPEWGYQLAAYQEAVYHSSALDHALKGVSPVNVCQSIMLNTSRGHEGELTTHDWLGDEIDKSWDVFCHLYDIWVLTNDYDPRRA